MFKRPSRASGFTLIETIVVIAIVVVVFAALLISVKYTLGIIINSKAKTSALSIASDRLEYIRSLPYDEVGTVAGIPAGAIPQTSTRTLNNVTFTERVLIEYVDDPADGLLTATTTDSNGIPADYKRAKVEVSWTVNGASGDLALVSNIVPRSIETTDGGGTVRINVIDQDSQPLAGAAVTLINNTTTTTINVTKFSDASGVVLFSGAPAASNYEVEVTGTGYSTDQTYQVSGANPSPITGPFAVLEADISTLTFQIDQLSDIALKTYSAITDSAFNEWFDDATGIATSTNTNVSGGVLRLNDTAGIYAPSGVAYLNVRTPTPLEQWETITVAPSVPSGTSYAVRVYTASSTTYTLIPDSDLPGNAAGFTNRIIDISSLDSATYPSVVLGVHLATTNTAVTPSIDAVELFYRESSTARSGVSISAHGNKVIGYDLSVQPIYKTVLTGSTNGTGNISFSDVEFDSYTFGFPGSFTVARACPVLPLQHRAGVDSDAEVVLGAHHDDSLLVTITNAGGTLIPGATVTLSRSGFSDTKQTNTCGQAFFSGVVAESDYQLDVSKSGYSSNVVTPYDLSGESTVMISVNES